jgi:outer membrane protein OmpA-like peptidoglycan-associated protein
MITRWLILQMIVCAAIQAADLGGAKDHPLVKRFGGSEIGRYVAKDYDEMKFTLGRVDFDYEKQSLKPFAQERKEGRRTSIMYGMPEGVSVLEAFRNYENALKEQGFEILFQGSGEDGLDNGYDRFAAATYKDTAPEDWFTPLTLTKDYRYLAAKKTRDDGGEIWASVYVVRNSEWDYPEFPKGRTVARLDVIETKAMGNRMVTVKAAEMAEKIDATGRVALYGITFDFNKTDLKPESKPTLDQIAKLLAEDATMKLLVVGHTDNVGAFEFNRDLSARRAAAVVAALKKDYGIAAERLFPFGVSFASPIASNTTEEGRAKNRRVELVKY